jgi:mono/diheme cytochrome c family protein
MKSRTVLFAYAAALALAVLALAACDELFPHRSVGEKLYRQHCADCHGVDGAGNTVRYMGNQWADLTDAYWKFGGDPVSVANVIEQGVPDQMPGFPQLGRDEVKAIVEHLRVLRGEKLPERAR